MAVKMQQANKIGVTPGSMPHNSTVLARRSSGQIDPCKLPDDIDTLYILNIREQRGNSVNLAVYNSLPSGNLDYHEHPMP
jgi:hypothetical protein